MQQYLLKSVLWSSDIVEFPNDREAWETLRMAMPSKFAVLYVLREKKLPVINGERFIESMNMKYGPKPIGHGGPDAELMTEENAGVVTYWDPVLRGITDDPYDEEKIIKP